MQLSILQLSSQAKRRLKQQRHLPINSLEVLKDQQAVQVLLLVFVALVGQSRPLQKMTKQLKHQDKLLTILDLLMVVTQQQSMATSLVQSNRLVFLMMNFVQPWIAFCEPQCQSLSLKNCLTLHQILAQAQVRALLKFHKVCKRVIQARLKLQVVQAQDLARQN